MRVIKPGRNQKGWSKEFICDINEGGCGSTVLVSEYDIICWDKYDYTGSYNTTCCKFVCGHCGVDNYIEKSVPFEVQERRMKKKQN